MVDLGLALWIAVVGVVALAVSFVSLCWAGGDRSILVIMQFLSGLLFAGQYIYLLVLTGSIVWVALKATRRISLGRNG